MKHIWSYTMMALCVSVTSAGVIDFPGNGKHFHSNEVARIKEEKLLTPPPKNGLNIDSSRLPGNSNGSNKKEKNCSGLCENKDLCLCDLPPFVYEAFETLFNSNKDSKEYEVVPFNKEDLIRLKSSELCGSLCSKGIEQPPCKCSSNDF